MAVKGAQSKMIVFNKLQEVFEGAFWEDEGKILRIPLEEDGSRVEIKVTLTAAKANLREDAAAPVITPITKNTKEDEVTFEAEITEDEKDRIEKLMKELGL